VYSYDEHGSRNKKEPILHIGGFTIREEADNALEKARVEKLKEKTAAR
jgi:hypothetical protein